MEAMTPFDRMQHLLWSFAQHRTLTVAARTGLLQHLAENEGSIESAAEALGLAEGPCGKMIRALVAMNIAQQSPQGFHLADELNPLFRSGPDSLVPFFEHSHQMYDGWGAHLENWLRSGRWPATPRTEEKSRVFGAAMQAIGRQTARIVSPAVTLEDADRLLDLGGGFGHWAEVFCERKPGLKVTVFDTPETARIATTSKAQPKWADRITFVGGDYLQDDLGSDFDIVLIANVLHQESAERAATLVKRGAAALRGGGRLAVVDFRIDNDQCGPLLGALFAINMRDFGDTWPEPQLRQWMNKAGLKAVTRIDAGADRWVITGTKPDEIRTAEDQGS